MKDMNNRLNIEWDKLLLKRFRRLYNSYHYCECAGCGKSMLFFTRKPKAYNFCSEECKEFILNELITYK